MCFRMQEVEIKRTRLYQDYQCQIDEVNRHKWIESEKAGHDVGWEWALIDWIIRHRATWIRNQLAMKSRFVVSEALKRR